MTRTLTSSSDVVPSGTITFYDSSNAPLPAGTYTLSVRQSIELGADQDHSPPDYLAQQTLVVTAPRFQLQPSDIQSVFPPAGATGTFAKTLPQMVLTRDLPWARPIVPGQVDSSSTPQPPWLALLVVYEAESQWVGAPLTTTVQNLVQPGTGVLPPDLGSLAADERSQVCQRLTVDLKWFQSVIPALDELPLLSHARNVDTTQKVTNLANGFWSVVIANRLPDASAARPTSTTMYLVSLEGHAQHLHGATIAGNYQSIALAALAHWSFVSTAFPGDFLGLLQSIGSHAQNQPLQMPTTPGIQASANDDAATRAVALGFVPLQNDLRTGETTTSWYRSPIVPYPTCTDPVQATYAVSDHAIRYDPETGMFDHSYAAAWQLGRLLGLSDAAFTQAMVAWRASAMSAVQTAPTLQRSSDLLQLAAPMGAAASHTQVQSHLLSRLTAMVDANKQTLPARKRRVDRNLGEARIATSDEFRARVQQGEDPLELLLSHLSRHR